MHIDRAFPRAAGRAAGGGQFLTLKDPPRLGGQGPEQPELGRRQGDPAPVGAGREPPPVQGQPRAVKAVVGPAGRLDPGQQGAETVFKIVPLLFPQRRAEFAIPLRLGGQQEHGPAARQQATANLAADIQGIGVRQVRIEQHDVRLGLAGTRHARPAVRRHHDPAAGRPQTGRQAGLQPFHRTDDQHGWFPQHATSTLCPRPHGTGAVRGFQISNFKSQISNLKSQISDLRSQISDLKSQISNLKSQISNLRSQISDLKSQISNLKSQISNSDFLPPTQTFRSHSRSFPPVAGS